MARETAMIATMRMITMTGQEAEAETEAVEVATRTTEDLLATNSAGTGDELALSKSHANSIKLMTHHHRG
jgi:hypothetical protein